MRSNAVNKYKKTFHYGDRNEIFRLLVENYEIQSAIYPGSYIHIAPSFHIPLTVYIDTYKKTKDFFNDRDIHDYIYKNRTYKEPSIIRFHHANYTSNFGEKLRDFDLLISLYAGFVSQSCKEYLKVGGILLTNNSHGDASIAYIDDDYQFIGVIYRSNRQYRLSKKNLYKYFVPKKLDQKITKDYLEKIQRGIGYTRSASNYVFKKLKN